MPESSNNGVRSGEDYSLYVTNVPVELNEAGIAKIFKAYGAVTAIIARGEFAFISYATYAEAENAIRSLDGKPPLDLRVQFRRKRVQASEDQENSQNVENYATSPMKSNCSASQSLVPHNQISRNVNSAYNSNNDSRLALLHSRFSPHHYQPMGALYPPNMAPYFMPYPYDKMDYADTNALWSRGITTIDATGRRRVTLGRGHTSYSICEPQTRMLRDLGTLYERRNPGCYKYGTDACQGYAGSCIRCSKSATLCCSVCETFYCSRSCQISDWPNHQSLCNKVPPLIGAKSEKSQPSSQHLEQSTEIIINPSHKVQSASEIITNQKPLRRPLSVANSTIPDKDLAPKIEEQTPNQCPVIAHQSAPIKPSTGQNYVPDEPKSTAAPKIVETVSPSANFTEQRTQETRNETASKPPDQHKLIETEKIIIDQSVENFLPSEFTEVQITSVIEPGKVFSARKLQDTETVDQLMLTLNENIKKFVTIEKPMIGEIYGVMYEGLLHRGLLLSIDPPIVDYIDWGTIEALTTNSFSNIGDLANSPPRFAQFIKVSDETLGKNLAQDILVHVKKINVEIENDIEVINVEVLAESVDKPLEVSNKIEPQEQIQTSKPEDLRPPSVLTYLTQGMALVAEIADVINKNSVRVVLMPESANQIFEALLNPFKEDCDKIVPNYDEYEPQIGEMVAAQKLDDVFWVRGHVIHQSPMTIASFDEGTVITQVQKIVPIVPAYKDLATFSATMTATVCLPDSVQIGSVVELEVTKVIEEIEVTMKTECVTIAGLKLRQWTPWDADTEQNPSMGQQKQPHQNKAEGGPRAEPIPPAPPIKKSIDRINLQTNTKVVIQSYRTPSLIFLRSLEKSEFERHSKLVQNVAKAALTAAPLTALPESADYVLSQFVDGNYYRAMVIATQAETKKIKVFYIDYGDVQVTSMDKLKVIPDELMIEATCVKKVRLHNVKTVPPTPEAVEYLAKLVSDEDTFIYEFHSSKDNEDYAVLKDATAGSCLNDKINYLLMPTWEREKLENEVKIGSVILTTDESIVKENEKLVAADKVLTLNDIEAGKLADVGQSVYALYLEPGVPGCKFVFAPENQELVVHVTSVMPELMKKYSEVTENYIPRANELCIAMFDDGNWYRGCCLQNEPETNSAYIFFIDFGNLAQVLHSNIRAMSQDFLKPEAFGCICNVYDFFENDDEEVKPDVLARLGSLMVQNERYKLEIVSFDGAEYVVKLPEIKAQLVAEGLLS